MNYHYLYNPKENPISNKSVFQKNLEKKQKEQSIFDQKEQDNLKPKPSLIKQQTKTQNLNEDPKIRHLPLTVIKKQNSFKITSLVSIKNEFHKQS